jgi:hypothetical protein
LLALAALACYGLAVLPQVPNVVAQVAGMVLCFIVTGVALAIAILPADASSGARYTAMAAGSLSVGVVGGMVLNPFPAGLNQFGWLTFALATALVACGVARVRGVSAPVHWKRPEFSGFSWAASAKVLASVVVVGAAIGISLVSENSQEKPFTDLWLVPDSPGQSPWGATHAELGIKSHEATTEDFTVVVDTSRQVMSTRVTLAPNQVWTQVVPVEGTKASAEIYRGSVTGQPYRAVWLVTR